MGTANKLVVLKLEGNFEGGFSGTLRIGLEGDRAASVQENRPLVEIPGRLPSNPDIPKHYERWQSAYRSLSGRMRLGGPARQPKNISLSQVDRTARISIAKINEWLRSEPFRPILEKLFEQLSPSETVRFIVQTSDRHLRQLPWHFWDFFDRYPNAEVAIGSDAYQWIEPSTQRETVRILAILGNSNGINIREDRQFLETLPDGAKTEFLVEPKRREFDQKLWDDLGWDILFFAGHGRTDEDVGRIFINPTESLEISQLKYALKTAIARGLHLAIFNSCEGLGTANALTQLNIPQIVVMREPVPDLVAQEFLKFFLIAFTSGKSLYTSVREARERLQGLEGEFPSATWLPIIYQNPAVIPPTWKELVGVRPVETPQPPRDIQLNNYLTSTIERLQQQGCLDIKKAVNHDGKYLDCVAKIADVELPFGMFSMRGDAFFIFCKFDLININLLRQLSTQCLEYARTQKTASNWKQVFNARVPSNICFSVAIVRDLDAETRERVQTENPFEHSVNLLWYEVPVIYTLNEQKLYFYDRPTFWDQFKGEIAWQRLRELIKKTLTP